MSLKAVFLNFSGAIVNDEAINQELLSDILLKENLRADEEEFTKYCRGRSDRAGLKDILTNRGRVLPDAYIDKLLANKAQAYRQKLESLPEIPLSDHLREFLTQLKAQDINVGLVTGAFRSEVEYVLQKVELTEYIEAIVAGDDLEASKPEPEPYLMAAKQLNVQPSECLAIEDNPTGIEAAKRAKIQVVGISNIYPLHMLQRQCDWTVDNFLEIELERVDRVLSQAG